MKDILEECLNRLVRGESVESCAERYPSHKLELVAMLQIASDTMDVVSSMPDRPKVKQRGLQRLIQAAENRRVARQGVFDWFRWNQVLAKPVAIGMLVVVLMTGTALGTAVASSDSVPGDSLYWVKRTREYISLVMPQSDTSRANKHIDLAVERGEEMGRLMIRGRYADAERHAEYIGHHINMTAGAVGMMGPGNAIEMPAVDLEVIANRNVNRLKVRVLQDRQRFHVGLMKVRKGLSPEAQRRLYILRLRSELRFRAMLAALGGQNSPTWGPIWVTEPIWEAR